MPRFSIIVPIYNRPDEAEELLKSLTEQTTDNFELVLVEDGSTRPCNEAVDRYKAKVNINYINDKPNTGRSDTRNVGMAQAKGDYFVFFDSDCIIPPQYFETLEKYLIENYADCFGGPDNAHESFSDTQKAINYAMTSFLTTGGIRGGKSQMEKFKPRTFNMGFSREVFQKVGGFNDMLGEDIDLSIRINNAGFRTALYQDVFVYHKRRVDFKKYYKQVHNFGTARINLAIIHQGSLKLVHTLPALLLLGGAGIIILSILISPYFLLLPAFYICLLFFDAFIKTRKIKIALYAVWASCIQIVGYGWGFIKSFVQKIVFQNGMENSETLKRIYK